METGHISSQDLSTPQVRRTERKDASGFANELEAAKAARAAASSHLPAIPPPDLIVEIDRAAERAHELAQANRELHFEKDKAGGRIVVQVRDLAGNVLRTIPPSSALDIMSRAGR